MTTSHGDPPPQDIRDQLRRDHELALAELEALRQESDAPRCRAMLGEMRRAWVIHALAEETVVYRALESVEAANDRADERFVEHELIDGLFDKLETTEPASVQWQARLNVARELIMRHIETEHEQMMVLLTQRFDAAGLVELGERFEMARDKLTLLEEAKAA
jgi:hemerythrin superfamily protein